MSVSLRLNPLTTTPLIFHCAVARHTAERISSATILFIAMIALQTLGLDFGISDLATQLLFQLPNSRTQELEGRELIPPVSPC